MTRIPLRRATSITLSSARKPSSLNSPGRRTWTQSPMSEPSRWTLSTYVRTTWPPIWRTDSSAVFDLVLVRPAPGIGLGELVGVLDDHQVRDVERDEAILAIAVEELVAAASEEVLQVVASRPQALRANRAAAAQRLTKSKKVRDVAIHGHASFSQIRQPAVCRTSSI